MKESVQNLLNACLSLKDELISRSEQDSEGNYVLPVDDDVWQQFEFGINDCYQALCHESMKRPIGYLFTDGGGRQGYTPDISTALQYRHPRYDIVPVHAGEKIGQVFDGEFEEIFEESDEKSEGGSQ
jgi:hypothetical protein